MSYVKKVMTKYMPLLNVLDIRVLKKDPLYLSFCSFLVQLLPFSVDIPHMKKPQDQLIKIETRHLMNY